MPKTKKLNPPTLAPKEMVYETTLVCPETIYNCHKAIRARLDHDPDAARHQMLKVTYSLDYGAPSHSYVRIVDHMLEQGGYEWRLHSLHIEVEPRVVKVILRKQGLVDLVEDIKPLDAYEMRLPKLLDSFAQVTGKETVPNPYDMASIWDAYMLQSPSSLRVFKINDKKIYCVYRVIFDLWEYSDDYPDVGWRQVE